jgi:hypothetical protein
MTSAEVKDLTERELKRLEALRQVVELLETLDDDGREWVIEKIGE